MIKITPIGDGGLAVTVTGGPAQLMLFYCLWQSKLWPGWEKHEGLGDPRDGLNAQLRNVVDSVDTGQGLAISIQGREFVEAVNFAVERLRGLDIHVERQI